MIGNSVVPGLPNRWVTPSSFSSARNAERPVILFFMCPPARRFIGPRDGRQMTKLGACKQWIAVMAALHVHSRDAASAGHRRAWTQNIENNPMQSRMGPAHSPHAACIRGTRWAVGTAQPDLILR